MTSKQFIRWSRLHERRSGHPLRGWMIAVAAGGALAAFVYWRGDQADPIAASRAWLAGALAAFALAFLRVPFHLYWRPDAALLAQLPIGGGPLFDAAWLRCIRAALATSLTILIGAAPLAFLPAHDVAWTTRELLATPIVGDVPALTPIEFALRHAALTGVLALLAACF